MNLQAAFANKDSLPLETDSGRLLRKHSGLLIYDKTERALAITKQMLNYYNTNLLIKMTLVKNIHLDQGCPILFMEIYLHAEFRSNPDQTHLVK